MGSLDLSPAYGRDYSDSNDAKKDWSNNRDFSTVLGYVNKTQTSELIKDGYNLLIFRNKQGNILFTVELT